MESQLSDDGLLLPDADKVRFATNHPESHLPALHIRFVDLEADEVA